jgi:hypothetical protein
MLDVSRLTVRSRRNRAPSRLGYIVLACGGLETTRLLLWTQQRPKTFEDLTDRLGRYY